MLFDPKWEIKTAKPIYQMEGEDFYAVKPGEPEKSYRGIALKPFAAWLAAQPPGKPYDFSDVFNCAAAQYLQSVGVAKSLSTVSMNGGPPGSVAGAVRLIASGFPRTFGAAAERARLCLLP